MSKINLQVFAKEDRAIIKKAAKATKKAERNEIKAQRRARIYGIMAAIGLIAVLDKGRGRKRRFR